MWVDIAIATSLPTNVALHRFNIDFYDVNVRICFPVFTSSARHLV